MRLHEWGTRLSLWSDKENTEYLFRLRHARRGAGYGFEAVGALEGEHPAGIFGWESADFVELLDGDDPVRDSGGG
jgi:hypothetical protein